MLALMIMILSVTHTQVYILVSLRVPPLQSDLVNKAVSNVVTFLYNLVSYKAVMICKALKPHM